MTKLLYPENSIVKQRTEWVKENFKSLVSIRSLEFALKPKESKKMLTRNMILAVSKLVIEQDRCHQ